MNTVTKTATYTKVDVANVVRRFKADLYMIADSTGAITQEKAAAYAHDVEALAQKGYLREVDLTLLSNGVEQRALSYTVDPDSGGLTSSRPGGVMWPRVAFPHLRIILFYTPEFDDEAEEAIRGKLKIGWSPTNADTSHSSLDSTGGRNYSSNSFGFQRKDWTK